MGTKERITGPFFKWFGSKWLSSKTLPAPRYDSIVEPFAGGAGYSLRYFEHSVYLYELDGHIARLWRWLIEQANEKEIREIPTDIPEGTDIRKIGLSKGQALLLKSWQRTNSVGNCWTISLWGNKPGQWTVNTRARVASEVGLIKHWRFNGRDGFDGFANLNDCPRTWFIDPPYQYNYDYGSLENIDYVKLANICWQLKGHRIVCEAICAKTGLTPIWLPFSFFGSRVTSRRKAENSHHSNELVFEEF
jgi:hypothetical protein